MIGYKDMTFCTFYEDCAKAKKCHRPLTEEVRIAANRWWNDTSEPPIAVFAEKPDCHIAAIVKVKKLQDNDCHWYWIPAIMVSSFVFDLENLPELDVDKPETYNSYGKFELKYDKYRTGGHPEVVPGEFEGIKVEILE